MAGSGRPQNFLNPNQVHHALTRGSFPADFTPSRVVTLGKGEVVLEDLTALSLTNSARSAAQRLAYPIVEGSVVIGNVGEAMDHLAPIIGSIAATLANPEPPMAEALEHQV